MKRRCQLLIIGAGPAGGYAAKTAAAAGLDVVLVERRRVIGRPVCCAEAISEVGLTTFVEPEASFISTDVHALHLFVAGGSDLRYHLGSRLGFVLDRPAFEKYLIDAAAGKGAEVLLEAYASAVSVRDDGPASVEVQTRNGRLEVTADFIIACDGVESQIGRMVGIPTGLKLKHCETTLQYRVSGISLDPRCLSFYVGKLYSPDGYLWVFPKSDQSANIGLGLNPASSDCRKLRPMLDSFMAERFPNGRIEAVSCGMVPKFIGFDILGRDNVLLAGDAARIIDSLTGAGIARALHTGKMAAEAVIAVAAGHSDRKELVPSYRAAVEQSIGGDMRVFQKAYPLFRKFDDGDWESLVRFLGDYLKKQKAGSIDPAAMLISAMTTAPRLLRLARHLFLLLGL